MAKRTIDEPWTTQERAVLGLLKTPARIQALLDTMAYSADPIYRSPRSVLRDRKAHCFDGALLAAAALRRIGHRPLVVDLRAVRDDDHVIAIYHANGAIGAIAKSNFAGLRYREPIFRSIRELAASYFELYYNVNRDKTLRAYSTALDLSRFDAMEWTTCDEQLERIAERLDRSRHFPLIGQAAIKRLEQVDARSYAAGLVGVNEAGLYRPREA